MEALFIPLIILVLIVAAGGIVARTLCTTLVTLFWLIVAAALRLVTGLVYALAVVFLAAAEALQALHDLRTRRRHARWLKTHQGPR
jgi:CBS domain containing-hemolysin-like protein